MFDSLRRALVAGGLLTVPAALALVAAQPLVFPSLGPSAYLLATRPDAPVSAPQRVVGSHLLGVFSGLLAYYLLASPATLTALPPAGSAALFGLVASATLAVVLTTAAMEATDTRHAPACATTLIVALGLLTTPLDAVLIAIAVLALVGTARLLDVFVGPAVSRPAAQ